jgi:hypothetical protein
LTAHGIQMSRIPIDVTLAHILLNAQKNNCLKEAIILSSLLSIQDIRIYPSEGPDVERARQAHSRFKSKDSDFISILKVWNFVWETMGEKFSTNGLRRVCGPNFLHFSRLKEWMELVKQFSHMFKIKDQIQSVNLEKLNDEALRQSLLAGFLSSVAKKNPEQEGYKLAGGSKDTFIHPGSNLAKLKPEWVMAAEVRETSRAFLCTVSVIQPEWIEKIAAHLCSHTYFNPQFNPKTGFVEASKKTLFKGLEISKGGKIHYEKINKEDAVDLFWREAIVGEQIFRSMRFLKHNLKSLETLEELIHKSRESTMPTEDELTEWYKKRAPNVCHQNDLVSFIHKYGDEALQFEARDWLVDQEAQKIQELWAEILPQKQEKQSQNEQDRVYPSEIQFASMKFKVNYVFDSTQEYDGISFILENSSLLPFSVGKLRLLSALYQHRLFEFAWSHLSPTLQEKLSESEVIHELIAAQTENPEWSWIRVWNTVLSIYAEDLGIALSLPKKWEKHADLHILVKKPGHQFHLKLSPDEGQLEFLENLQKSNALNPFTWSAFGLFFSPLLQHQKNKGWDLWAMNSEIQRKHFEYEQKLISYSDADRKKILATSESLQARMRGLGALVKMWSKALALDFFEAKREIPDFNLSSKSKVKDLSSLKSVEIDLKNDKAFAQNHTPEGMAKTLLASSVALGIDVFVACEKWVRAGFFSKFDRTSELFLQNLCQNLSPTFFDEFPEIALLVTHAWAREMKWIADDILFCEDELFLIPFNMNSIKKLCEDRQESQKEWRKKRKILRQDIRKRLDVFDEHLPLPKELKELCDVFENSTEQILYEVWVQIEKFVSRMELEQWRRTKMTRRVVFEGTKNAPETSSSAGGLDKLKFAFKKL